MMKFLLALALVSTASAFIIEHEGSDRSNQGYMTLFEGNGGSRDVVCNLGWSENTAWNFKNHEGGCQNDEARSVMIHKAKAGTIITFYDSPAARTDDDYVVVEVVNDITSDILLVSFEENKSGSHIRVTYHHHNGLDGKVSLATVQTPDAVKEEESTVEYANGEMALYNEIGGTGEVVCNLEWRERKGWNFEKHEGGCQPGVTKSVKIKEAKVGTKITFSDDGHGSTRRDFVTITVLKDIRFPLTIDSLEENYRGEYVYVHYHHYQGLIGRVAMASVSVPSMGEFEVESRGPRSGEMNLFNGNGATGDELCDLSWSTSKTWNIARGEAGCKSTGGRSVIIESARAGTTIRFYRSAFLRIMDDYAVVTIKKDLDQPITIPSFESDVNNEYFNLYYRGILGLDGHVAFIKVQA